MIRCLDDHYDVIYCDIDNTIVYGFMNDLMDVAWKYTHSDLIADMLMTIQAKFKLYKVNHKLVHMLKTCEKPVVFLTARKYHPSTPLLLFEVLRSNDITVVPLRTDSPAEEKVQYILNNQWCDTERFCIFDDNKKVRDLAMEYDIDAFDPTPLYEGMVK